MLVIQELQESMQDHLKLHFEHEEATEEQVLATFPTALRRRILRHLYLEPLRAVYLFKGTRQKFLDALISVGRLELFMPAVSFSPRKSVPVDVCECVCTCAADAPTLPLKAI